MYTPRGNKHPNLSEEDSNTSHQLSSLHIKIESKLGDNLCTASNAEVNGSNCSQTLALI